MKIERLDHLVLTVRNVEATCDFYSRVLHFEAEHFAGGRCALRFGNQKINLHQADAVIAPHALRPTPWSADLCFVTDTPIAEVISQLRSLSVSVEEGLVQRTGAAGPITSVYFRDPDSNLIEVSKYD